MTESVVAEGRRVTHVPVKVRTATFFTRTQISKLPEPTTDPAEVARWRWWCSTASSAADRSGCSACRSSWRPRRAEATAAEAKARNASAWSMPALALLGGPVLEQLGHELRVAAEAALVARDRGDLLGQHRVDVHPGVRLEGARQQHEPDLVAGPAIGT